MKVPLFRGNRNDSPQTPSNGTSTKAKPSAVSSNDDASSSVPSHSCTSFILRSCKTGGYEGESPYLGVDASTVNDVSIHTDGTSVNFESSWVDPDSVATERAVNSSAISRASAAGVSTASTVPMGTGNHNPRTRRREKRRPPRTRPKPQREESGGMGPGPLWRPATEESNHVRTFSMASNCESETSAPITMSVSDMLKKLNDFEDESKQDPHPLHTTSKDDITGSKPSKAGKNSPPTLSYRFEFDDVVLSNRRSNRRPIDLDDDVCGSVYSFSFSQDDEGTGFELDDFQEVWEGSQNPDAREESSESSSNLELGTSAPLTDEGLMDRCSSPGALRLTEKGLSKHEKDKFKETLMEQPDDPFEAWKHGQEAKKFIRQRHNERKQEKSTAVDPAPPKAPAKEETVPVLTLPPLPAKALSKHSSHKQKTGLLMNPFRKSSSLGMDENLSLVPLEDLEQNLQISVSSTPLTKHRSEEGRSLGGFGKIFRKRSSRCAPTAQSVLDKEREFAQQEEEERKKKDTVKQQQLRERSSKRRLDLHRKRDRQKPPQNPNPAMLQTPKASAPTRNNNEDDNNHHTPSTTCSTEHSAGQPSPVSPLPPCAVCHNGERTHIATPCMHFSFCASCAIRLGDQSYGICPVCSEPNVKYAAVSV